MPGHRGENDKHHPSTTIITTTDARMPMAVKGSTQVR
jgi:hypothetical protein